MMIFDTFAECFVTDALILYENRRFIAVVFFIINLIS